MKIKRISYQSLSKTVALHKEFRKIPIKKQPIKFTIKVPKGKPNNIIFARNELKRNLEIAPKKAPTPIRR